jgi:hypothetical protein
MPHDRLLDRLPLGKIFTTFPKARERKQIILVTIVNWKC